MKLDPHCDPLEDDYLCTYHLGLCVPDGCVLHHSVVGSVTEADGNTSRSIAQSTGPKTDLQKTGSYYTSSMSYINDIEITIARRAFFLACTRWSAASMKITRNE